MLGVIPLAKLCPEIVLTELSDVLTGTLGGRAADYFLGSLTRGENANGEGIGELSEQLSTQLVSVFGPRVASVLEHLLVRRLSSKIGISASGHRESLVDYVGRVWKLVEGQ